jgi:hypothetical protein
MQQTAPGAGMLEAAAAVGSLLHSICLSPDAQLGVESWTLLPGCAVSLHNQSAGCCCGCCNRKHYTCPHPPTSALTQRLAEGSSQSELLQAYRVGYTYPLHTAAASAGGATTPAAAATATAFIRTWQTLLCCARPCDLPSLQCNAICCCGRATQLRRHACPTRNTGLAAVARAVGASLTPEISNTQAQQRRHLEAKHSAAGKYCIKRSAEIPP